MDRNRRDPLTEEALRWLVVLNDADATDEDRRAFDAWLGGDPNRRAAWDQARQVWSRLDTLTPALRVARRPRSAPATDADGGRRGRMSRRHWMAAAAAGVVLVAGGFTVGGPALFADARTGVGERRTVWLADGSSVELGSASALSVSYDASARLLTLHEGEAFFTVAADANRPFIVVAADGRSVALGTAFNVKRAGDAVIVTVAEHAVAVSSAGGASLTVSEGQQLRYGAGGVGRVTPADPSLAQAWRRDRLVFHDSPLIDVVADLERFRHGRILITDDRIAGLPVTAVINTRNTDAALAAIADALPVRVRRVTDFLVLLSPRD